MILRAGHYADVAVGGVRVVHGQNHDRSLVTAGQLAYRLEADQRKNDRLGQWWVLTKYGGKICTILNTS